MIGTRRELISPALSTATSRILFLRGNRKLDRVIALREFPALPVKSWPAVESHETQVGLLAYQPAARRAPDVPVTRPATVPSSRSSPVASHSRPNDVVAAGHGAWERPQN